MRVLFYTILITVGLSLSVVVLVPSFFDLNTYKPKLYKLVKSQTGFDLEIKGPIGLSILPKLNLNANNVTLSDKKETLFRAKNLNIYLSLYSLLRGNLFFDGIKLDTAKIFIKKKNNNSYNWDIKKPKKKDSQQNEINENKTNIIDKNNRNLVIKNLYLSNTSIEYQDNKNTYNLEKIFINLKQSANNTYKLNGSFYYNNKELSFNYNTKILEKTITYDGEINSEIFRLNNSGEYNINLNEGTVYLDGSLKNLKKLTNIDDLKIDELDINTKIIIDNNNLNFETLKIYNKEANLYGKGNLKTNKNNIHLLINLHSNYLNLDKIYSAIEKNNVSGNKSNNEKNQNNNKTTKEVDKNIFDILKNININSKINSAKVFYKGFEVNDIALKFDKKKNINIEVKAKNFFQSSLVSQLQLNDKMQYSFITSLKDFNLKDLNNYYKLNLIEGKIDLNTNLKGLFVSKNQLFPFREILFNSNGVSILTGNQLVIKNLNLNNLKENVKNLKNLKQITGLKKSLFQGDTSIADQEIKIIHKEEILKIPLTKFTVGNDPINVLGEYNIKSNNIEVNSSYDTNDSFLSLFKIKTEGIISNPTTTLSFDDTAVSLLLKKLAEKELKKSLEKKIEKKFDNIIDNLLEEF